MFINSSIILCNNEIKEGQALFKMLNQVHYEYLGKHSTDKLLVHIHMDHMFCFSKPCSNTIFIICTIIYWIQCTNLSLNLVIR